MKLRQLVAGLMAISILATGGLLSSRISAERSSRNVEIVADYGEMKDMADQSNLDLVDWFKRFKVDGVTTVAVEEETFKSLKDEGMTMNYGIYKVVKQNVDWDRDYPKAAVDFLNNRGNDYNFIVETKEPAAIAQIDLGLKRGLEPDMYHKFIENGKATVYVIEGELSDLTYESGSLITDADEKILERPITPYSSKLELLGLGFDKHKIEQVKQAGLEASPRPRSNTKAPWKLVDAFEADIKAYDLHPSHIIFSGSSVLGYESDQVPSLDKLLQMLDRNHISLSLIEAGNQRGNTEQDGILYLVDNAQYDVVRVFPIVKYIQKRFAFYNYSGPEEIENTIYRAATERNIRSVYFRPFMKNERVYITEPAEYDKMFSSLQNRLSEHGLSLGKTSGFKYNDPSLVLRLLSGMGVVVLGAYMLGCLFDLKNKIIYTLFGLGFVGTAGALFVAPNFTTSILAMSAAILYPGAAIYLFVHHIRQAFLSENEMSFKAQVLEGAKILLIGTLLSLLGGLTVGGQLSHSSYLYEIQYFRGVKATLAAPFVIYTFIYLVLFGYNRSRDAIKKEGKFFWDFTQLLNLNIKIGYLVLMAIAGAIGYVYLARSGHETNLQPSEMEMIFRNILEYKLLARPRTKEFLLAFPMVMATMVFARAKIKMFLYPSGLLAVIGFASIANTFSHLRTPIYLSVARTAYSISFGLVIGIAFAILALLIVKIMNRYFRSASHE